MEAVLASIGVDEAGIAIGKNHPGVVKKRDLALEFIVGPGIVSLQDS
jgi:hypothetical protein